MNRRVASEEKFTKKELSADGILSFVPVFDRLLFADEKDVAAAEFVLDAYYFRDTRLLQCARKYGKIAVDGLDMLFFQAIKAFEIFTSVKRPMPIRKRFMRCSGVKYENTCFKRSKSRSPWKASA